MLTIGLVYDKLNNVVATDKNEMSAEQQTKMKKLLTDSKRSGNLI